MWQLLFKRIKRNSKPHQKQNCHPTLLSSCGGNGPVQWIESFPVEVLGKGNGVFAFGSLLQGPSLLKTMIPWTPFDFFSCPNCFSHCLEYVLCFSGIVVMFRYLRNSTFFGFEFACVVSIPLVKCLTKEAHPWNIESPFCYNVIVSDLTVCD